MLFSEILSAFYDECGYATSPATAVVTRAKRFVNEGVRVLLNEPCIARQVDSDLPYSFASVASTARYTVPEAVSVIRHITERTNDYHLLPMSMSEYRLREPDPPNNTGTPTHYVPIGRVAVATQPSDASAVFVDSTSAGDTNTAYIEGIATSTVGSSTVGGRPFSGSRTMTGATAVQLPSTVSTWTEITDFYLSAVAVGHVTLCEDAEGGTELARIVPGQYRARYYGFYLWPTPAAAVTYYVDYRRQIQDLVQDTDEPVVPLDFHPMLLAYAVMREAEKTGNDVLLARTATRYTRFMNNMTYQVGTLTDEIPVVGRHRERERRSFYSRAAWPIT